MGYATHPFTYGTTPFLVQAMFLAAVLPFAFQLTLHHRQHLLP
jgi:hypothetical protein